MLHWYNLRWRSTMSSSMIAGWFVGVLLVVTGVSHILRPREWAGYFQHQLREPWAGFVIGMPTLAAGLAIVLMHPAWAWGLSVIVTVVGWGWTVKGTLYLLWPGLPRRVAARHLERPERFRWAGGIAVALGGLALVGHAAT